VRSVIIWARIRDVSLVRIAWLTVVIACLVGAVLLFISDYHGYGGVTLAVAAAAAINLK